MQPNKKAGILSVIGKKLDNGAYLCTVSLNAILFADYQRDAIKKHVEKIAGTGFDPQAANLLKCSLRDGHVYCFDGRQTTNALIRRGYHSFQALVWQGLTYQQEAHYFFLHNDAPMRMNGWTNFYASIRAGNDAHRLIADTIRSHNLTLPKDPGIHKNAHADVTSCRAFQEAFAKGSLRLVERLCIVLDKCWRIGRNAPVCEAAKRTDLLRGLADFLHANQDISDRLLVDTLKRYQPEEIRNIANRKKSKGRIDKTQIKLALADAFNIPARFAA